ncbi:MAG TPA: magnesium/cobalt transporter CorA [Marinospirillum sp.]|uniref:magnesium/cobalt transporter CorA n=1 Tax=Marinospirillum sp. TaxID=2183934 RepID=UPI002B47B2DA|nr:magnesium/cobalt transporter CorA [Marinospirillum sp.]HKM15516.1 magnesium/cobalt transporter CorA [Marinospirillum sp.]
MSLNQQDENPNLGFRSLFNRPSTGSVQRKKPGQPPGTLLHTGEQKLDKMLMKVHDYDANRYDSFAIEALDPAAAYLRPSSKTWIQIQGLHDITELRKVMDYFELHPLVQEDIVSINQRPKVEPYGEIIFVVARMITTRQKGEETELKSEQVSLVLGKNFVLSFQESDDPLFDPVIRRMLVANTRLRRHSIDFLAYALLDNLVDHYFTALDFINETIEDMEERVLENPDPADLQSIHALRRDLIFFRKSAWSLRDGVNGLIRDDSPLISAEIKIYLRDVYDHLVQVIDSIESQRELVFSLYDMYTSSLSDRMNEVMKVLTVISTLFIPLTFIVGVYGMNFNPDSSAWNMPELNWAFGYPAAWGLMLVITASMLYYFKRKGWF